MKRDLNKISKKLLNREVVDVVCDNDGIEFLVTLQLFKNKNVKCYFEDGTVKYVGNPGYVRFINDDSDEEPERYELIKVDQDNIQQKLEDYFIQTHDFDEILTYEEVK